MTGQRGRRFLFVTVSGNFTVYQDRLETYLLQLFAHSENSILFSIISVIVFEVNIVAEQKEAYW